MRAHSGNPTHATAEGVPLSPPLGIGQIVPRPFSVEDARIDLVAHPEEAIDDSDDAGEPQLGLPRVVLRMREDIDGKGAGVRSANWLGGELVRPASDQVFGLWERFRVRA